MELPPLAVILPGTLSIHFFVYKICLQKFSLFKINQAVYELQGHYNFLCSVCFSSISMLDRHERHYWQKRAIIGLLEF